MLAGKLHRIDGVSFDLGTGGVIKGCDVGFATMQVRVLQCVLRPQPPSAPIDRSGVREVQ